MNHGIFELQVIYLDMKLFDFLVVWTSYHFTPLSFQWQQ
jgi:hypothetical protein